MAEAAQTDIPTKFDPEEFRMTIGEHLEELRHRLVLAIAGFVVAIIICMIFGEKIMVFFCQPLVDALTARSIPPQLHYTDLSDPFMTYIKVSLVCAGAIAGPWMIFQLWLFVASGLYHHERKVVTRYIPLSVILMVSGMVFVYTAVLPMTVGILVDFGSGIKLPVNAGATIKEVPTTQQLVIPELAGDPEKPLDGQLWVNDKDGQVKIHRRGKVFVLAYGPRALVTPILTLGTYIDLVLFTLITFGVSFQLPLVIMALIRVGIVDPATLRGSRRTVYFILAIAAAVIAPGDVVTAMLALLGPLILLYEMGIWLGARALRRAEAAAVAAEAADREAEKKDGK